MTQDRREDGGGRNRPAAPTGPEIGQDGRLRPPAAGTFMDPLQEPAPRAGGGRAERPTAPGRGQGEGA